MLLGGDMEKVYCEDCEYCNDIFGGYEKAICKHPNYYETIDTPYRVKEIYGNIYEINKNNNCELFKKMKEYEDYTKQESKRIREKGSRSEQDGYFRALCKRFL
jgi:hypothetical protein